MYMYIRLLEQLKKKCSIHIVRKSDFFFFFFFEFLCKHLELKAETFTEFWTCFVEIRNKKIFTDVI